MEYRFKTCVKYVEILLFNLYSQYQHTKKKVYQKVEKILSQLKIVFLFLIFFFF